MLVGSVEMWFWCFFFGVPSFKSSQGFFFFLLVPVGIWAEGQSCFCPLAGGVIGELMLIKALIKTSSDLFEVGW